MPTGVAMHDARAQLFAAAERVLERDGPGGLTSRAVTTEAGCAKGVLHRRFVDFDAFLAELVLDRVARVESQALALYRSAGSGTVTDNLTAALLEIFGPLAVAVVGLVMTRDGVRARVRQAGSVGIPVLREGGAMLSRYMVMEQDRGRISADADVGTISITLIGAVHLLFTEGGGGPVEAEAVRAVVTTVVGGVVLDPGDS